MGKTYINKKEEYALIESWQKNRDEEARTKLIRAHDKYCRTVAYKYMGKKHDHTLDDLHQHARIGLLLALDKFDTSKGVRFLTYADRCMRGEIQNYIDYKGYTVHQSVPILRDIEKIGHLRERFFSKAGRYPNIEELSSMSGYKPKKISNILARAANSVSLDAPQRDLYNESMLDHMQIDDEDQPLEEAAFKEFLENIKGALNCLSEEEKALIEMRFLSDDDIPPTYEDMGQKIGISRSAAYKIQQKALKKLGHILAPELA